MRRQIRLTRGQEYLRLYYYFGHEVNPKVLDAKFAGRDFDALLLDELPGSVDPCGERGEFHSFAYAGPMFSKPIAIKSNKSLNI